MELEDGKIIFPDDPEFPFRTYHDYYDKDDDDSAEVSSKSNRVTSTKAPNFPSKSPNHDDHEHGKLSMTAIVFIGIAIAIIILIIIAALYFLWKSRRRASQPSKGIKQKTKGRGVTRPSFLPSHHEHVQQQVVPRIMPRKNESIHLDIPSPEWCNTSYPIITPYSFSSTSTVITSEPQESIDSSMSLVESYEKELAKIESSLNKRKESTEAPVKPTRSKVAGGGKLTQQKNLPNHRVTVL